MIKSLFLQIIHKLKLKKIYQKGIIHAARIGRTDLLNLAYNDIGILNYENKDLSGENHLLKEILPNLIRNFNPVFFDVGANMGSYSILLKKHFPNSTIYAFEPNPNAYKLLKIQLDQTGVNCQNIGFGSEKEVVTLYNSRFNQDSEHSTLFKEVFLEVHKKKEEDIESINMIVDRLDDFCLRSGIDHIDFLKIDTEGYEYEVLRGANRMLTNNRIQVIQFEFNEMNIYSRVFLRDFFQILGHYSLFRLAPNYLIPLEPYDPIHEIFKFQNIIAIKKS